MAMKPQWNLNKLGKVPLYVGINDLMIIITIVLWALDNMTCISRVKVAQRLLLASSCPAMTS